MMGQNKFFKFSFKINKTYFKRKLIRWFKYFGDKNNTLLGLLFFNALKNKFVSYYGNFIIFKKRFFSRIIVKFTYGFFPSYTAFLNKTRLYRIEKAKASANYLENIRKNFFSRNLDNIRKINYFKKLDNVRKINYFKKLDNSSKKRSLLILSKFPLPKLIVEKNKNNL